MVHCQSRMPPDMNMGRMSVFVRTLSPAPLLCMLVHVMHERMHFMTGAKDVLQAAHHLLNVFMSGQRCFCWFNMRPSMSHKLRLTQGKFALTLWALARICAHLWPSKLCCLALWLPYASFPVMPACRAWAHGIGEAALVSILAGLGSPEVTDVHSRQSSEPSRSST